MNLLQDLFSLATFIIILLGIGLLVSGIKLNMMVFLVLNLLTILVGLIMLESATPTVIAYAAGIAGLVVGYIASSTYRGGSRGQGFATQRSVSKRAFPDVVVYGVVFFVGFLGLYHLLVAGVPVFSSSIEVKRFDFTSSGLLGLPGRMYLYGIPFAWMMASANAQTLGVPWRSYGPWRLATTFFILTALSSGFKSGLLAAMYTMLIAYFIISRRRISIRRFAIRYWWAFALPLMYGLSVAASYSTYDVAGRPLWEQLLRRVTIVGAQPVQYAMRGSTSNFVENGFLNDAYYYFVKYSGNETSRMFSLERSISADIIGADPSSSAWTTPVTVGGFAEITYSFGAFAAVTSMICVGILIGVLHGGVVLSPVSGTLRAIIAYGIYNWLLKGGLVYYLLNFVAVVAVLAGIAFLSWILLVRPKSSHLTRETRGYRKDGFIEGSRLRSHPGPVSGMGRPTFRMRSSL